MTPNVVRLRGRSTDDSLRYTCLFVRPIDRWSYAVHPRGPSTDGYVLYTSHPNLIRWTWGLDVADGPMGHTVIVLI